MKPGFIVSHVLKEEVLLLKIIMKFISNIYLDLSHMSNSKLTLPALFVRG